MIFKLEIMQDVGLTSPMTIGPLKMELGPNSLGGSVGSLVVISLGRVRFMKD